MSRFSRPRPRPRPSIPFRQPPCDLDPRFTSRPGVYGVKGEGPPPVPCPSNSPGAYPSVPPRGRCAPPRVGLTPSRRDRGSRTALLRGRHRLHRSPGGGSYLESDGHDSGLSSAQWAFSRTSHACSNGFDSSGSSDYSTLSSRKYSLRDGSSSPPPGRGPGSLGGGGGSRRGAGKRSHRLFRGVSFTYRW